MLFFKVVLLTHMALKWIEKLSPFTFHLTSNGPPVREGVLKNVDFPINHSI